MNPSRRVRCVSSRMLALYFSLLLDHIYMSSHHYFHPPRMLDIDNPNNPDKEATATLGD